MKNRTGSVSLPAAGAGILLLILDSRCAAESAQTALDLCLRTVIPGLFPMFVLSGILISQLSGSSGRAAGSMERILGLPSGGGTLFLLGSIGGFPVGAQCIVQAVDSGTLSRRDGEKMLGFCNNCSPAFLFGMLGGLFSGSTAPLLILLIQLECAMLIAAFTDFSDSGEIFPSTARLTLTGAVSRAIRSMVSVCAWVLLAGVVTGFLDRWIFPLLPEPIPQITGGLLEVTGGVLGLSQIPEERTRFVLCAAFVCFGGGSVLMQIQSLASEQGLSIRLCFRQKMLQGLLGAVLSGMLTVLGPICLLAIPLFLLFRKIILEKPSSSVYNSYRKGGFDHVIPKKD